MVAVSPIEALSILATASASPSRAGSAGSASTRSGGHGSSAGWVLSTTIGAAEDRCSLAGDGQELEIGFNVRYLAEALRVIPSEEVTLELTNGLSPIVLTPVDEKEDFAYMVLPVRIKNG